MIVCSSVIVGVVAVASRGSIQRCYRGRMEQRLRVHKSCCGVSCTRGRKRRRRRRRRVGSGCFCHCEKRNSTAAAAAAVVVRGIESGAVWRRSDAVVGVV